MTETKTEQPRFCPYCHGSREQCEANEYCQYRWPTPVEVTQPQLPPYPGLSGNPADWVRYADAVKAENESLKAQHSYFVKLHEAEMRKQLEAKDVLSAENESLKAQLEERNNRGTGYLYVPKAQYDALKAERDTVLEVIRALRKNHGCIDMSEWSLDHKHHLCPTCIKADALLTKEKA